MDVIKDILPTRLYEITERAGICTPKQIIVLSLWDIKKLTNLTNDDIMMLKNIVNQYYCPASFTGVNLQMREERLKTCCTAIDNILKGGFRKGTITEIYGESGSGKTQVVMQVAADCTDNGSVFICTEDLFPVKRYNQIRQHICKLKGIESGRNMFIEHLTEAHELISCIRVRLPQLLNTNKISLVILDSVAAPFRCDYTNYIHRAEELRELGILLYKLAQHYNIVIICINQVTSSFDYQDHILPSLGLVWSNMTCYKLKINRRFDASFIKGSHRDIIIRELRVMSAPDLPVGVAKFIITQNGIENVK